MGPAAAGAVPALAEMMLQDPNGYVRGSAATALGQIDLMVAIQALEEALKDEDADVRRHAESALRLINRR
jgi:HEAT repeat protein